MKKKIAILGSTGSIGKTLIEIIKKAKILNVKNLIISNKKSFDEFKKKKN